MNYIFSTGLNGKRPNFLKAPLLKGRGAFKRPGRYHLKVSGKPIMPNTPWSLGLGRDTPPGQPLGGTPLRDSHYNPGLPKKPVN